MIHLRVSRKQLLSVQICGRRKICFLLAFGESFEGCWHISMTHGPQIAGMILSWPLEPESLNYLSPRTCSYSQNTMPSTWPSSGFRVFLPIYWQRHVKASGKKKKRLALSECPCSHPQGTNVWGGAFMGMHVYYTLCTWTEDTPLLCKSNTYT